MALNPVHSGYRYAVELGGLFAGWISAFAGGNAIADVIEERPGPDGIVRKHIANVKYEDIEFECGTGMSSAFYEWIGQTLVHKPLPRAGAIVEVDHNFSAKACLEFGNALISEVDFPALDVSSKDRAQMTIKISPEYTRYKKGDGAPYPGKSDMPGKSQKQWVKHNFRLEIGGLDCSRVTKIDAIKVRQAFSDDPVGGSRDQQRVPTHLEIANVAITVPASHAEDFYAWYEDFLIKGNNGPDAEKNAAIEMLTLDLKSVLSTLTLKQVGIYRLARERADRATDAVPQLRAEMYCEEIQFDYSGAVG